MFVVIVPVPGVVREGGISFVYLLDVTGLLSKAKFSLKTYLTVKVTLGMCEKVDGNVVAAKSDAISKCQETLALDV